MSESDLMGFFTLAVIHNSDGVDRRGAAGALVQVSRMAVKESSFSRRST